MGADAVLVDAGDAVLPVFEETAPGDGVAAVEQAEQVLCGHLAGEPEPLREGAEGPRRAGVRGAVLGEVVIPEVGVRLEEIVGDRAEVAFELGLADGHLSRSGRVLYVVLGSGAIVGGL